MHEPLAGIGFSAWQCPTPNMLDERLHTLAELGYDHVELEPAEWDVWFSGRINDDAIAPWLAVLERYRSSLRFTLHAPSQINLFDRQQPRLHEALLHSTLELALVTGAELVVLHPGKRTAADWQGDRSMHDLMARERETLLGALQQLGAPAPTIALETLHASVDHYSYAVWPRQLATQLDEIAHPAVAACLDTGHALLAARWFGFELLDDLRQLAPYVAHIHLQDTFGHEAPNQTGVGDAMLGHGDMHLPPGWGSAPLREIFVEIDFPRRPVLLVELETDRFIDHAATTLERCRSLIAQAPSVPGARR
jgi:sugar phosphate isomerase/epimerase